MKITTFVLSICGFWIFYITNADWLDEWYDRFMEEFVGCDYEEVAPFISSVTAGTAEFDQIVKEFGKPKPKWFPVSGYFITLFIALISSFLLYKYKCLWENQGIIKSSLKILKDCYLLRRSRSLEENENFTAKKRKRISGNENANDVKLLWKGGNILESSMHCNIRSKDNSELRLHRARKRRLKSGNYGRGDEGNSDLAENSSDDSTAKKMVEIRKLLESEQEIAREFSNNAEGSLPVNLETKFSRNLVLNNRKPRIQDIDQTAAISERIKILSEDRFENRQDEEIIGEAEEEDKANESPDKKLMNRIRLLESRLRLEELKNKNWISRMTRAEGILQQLNKQVERIEETRPMETLTETLKVTSTVTNWASTTPHPRRNVQFTLVNQYPPFYLPTPYTSLSDVIKKEFQIGLPSSGDYDRSLHNISLNPAIPALPSQNGITPSSFLSKFLSR